jgi:Ni,Fe-hydrogenase III small subunit
VSDAPLPDASLRARLARWARLRGRSAFVVVGCLDSDAARAFADRLIAGDALSIPVDARRPERADVLVVVGRVTHKLAPVLVAAQRRMGPGAVVLAFDSDEPPHYAAAPADAVIAVDVLVRGLSPDDGALRRALAAVDAALAARAAAGDDDDAPEDRARGEHGAPRAEEAR